VCRVRNWDEIRIRGRFIRFADTENPTVEVVQSKWIYALEVPKKTHIIIALHQEDERNEGVLPRRPYLDFGLAVLKMEQESGSQLVQQKDFMIQRDTEVELILEAGQYLIVPRTTGVGIKRPEGAESESIKLIDS